MGVPLPPGQLDRCVRAGAGGGRSSHRQRGHLCGSQPDSRPFGEMGRVVQDGSLWMFGGRNGLMFGEEDDLISFAQGHSVIKHVPNMCPNDLF